MATDGPAATNSLSLPDVMKAPIHPDLVNSVHALMRNNSRQPYAVSRHTYRIPFPSFPSKNGGRNHFSSSLFCNSSTNSLSSNPNLSLQFQKARQNLVITSTPRPLTIISMAPPKPGGKAKKVTGMIKLALEAGKATPAPPVGPALGSKGVNASDSLSRNGEHYSLSSCLWSISSNNWKRI